MTQERHASWGHWSITFWRRTDLNTSYLPGELVAEIAFPVGNCGPMDGYIGSLERMRYRQMVRDWIDRGIVPYER